MTSGPCTGASLMLVSQFLFGGGGILEKGKKITVLSFFSPSVQFARWAHLHRFLSVRPSGLDHKSDLSVWR